MLRRLFLIVALLPLTACKPFQSQYALDTVPPPDFSLEVAVATPWRGDVGALATPSQYVVMPNRALHAAIGPGATIQYFPPTTARLSHEQFAALWAIIDENKLREVQGLSDAQAARILLKIASEQKGGTIVGAKDMPAVEELAKESPADLAEQREDEAIARQDQQLVEATQMGVTPEDVSNPADAGWPAGSQQPKGPNTVEPVPGAVPGAPGIVEVPADQPYVQTPVEEPKAQPLQGEGVVVDEDETPAPPEAAADEKAPGELPGELPKVLMQVVIRGYGQHHQFITTPDATPGAAKLVELLAKYRGWTPVLEKGPDHETLEAGGVGSIQLRDRSDF